MQIHYIYRPISSTLQRRVSCGWLHLSSLELASALGRATASACQSSWSLCWTPSRYVACCNLCGDDISPLLSDQVFLSSSPLFYLSNLVIQWSRSNYLSLLMQLLIYALWYESNSYAGWEWQGAQEDFGRIHILLLPYIAISIHEVRWNTWYWPCRNIIR